MPRSLDFPPTLDYLFNLPSLPTQVPIRSNPCSALVYFALSFSFTRKSFPFHLSAAILLLGVFRFVSSRRFFLNAYTDYIYIYIYHTTWNC